MASLDVEQLSGWYEAYGGELRLFARQFTDEARAEDIVQEAFLRLMRQRRCPDRVRAWLFRVVRNLCVSALRRLQVRRFIGFRRAAAIPSWFESDAEARLDARAAQQALEGLPLGQREIVVLRIWGQMSLQEIAWVVKKPLSTVHYQYRQALVALRGLLEVPSWSSKKISS